MRTGCWRLAGVPDDELFVVAHRPEQVLVLAVPRHVLPELQRGPPSVNALMTLANAFHANCPHPLHT